MLALCVTCRPHFQPWFLHQLAKQEHEHRLIVFDDCSASLRWDGFREREVVRPANRLQLTLGEKRQLVLDEAAKLNEPFAWFDDDDWHPKDRLIVASVVMLDTPENNLGPVTVDVVGYHEGLFVDVKTQQTRRLDTGTRVTFNGAVFAPRCASHRFQPVNRGEDTLWLQSILKDATVVSSPIMQHCWLSHDGNVTGKRGSMSFEGPRFQRFDSWELEFLRSLS